MSVPGATLKRTVMPAAIQAVTQAKEKALIQGLVPFAPLYRRGGGGI